jgi:CRISPR-associated protein Cmr6
MTFDRPRQPSRPINNRQQPVPPTQQNTNKPVKRVIPNPPGGGGGNRENRAGGGGHGNSDVPSPWLGGTHHPDATAGFVEYLRWMRSPDSEYRDPTKVQILQMAAEGAKYQDRLKVLNQRTKAIAGDKNWFAAKSTWRMRVGGHRGPENILLPAFDALGMPYLPASTLRGVARTQAIRHFMVTEDLSWAAAEQKIGAYFGSLDAADQDRSGKVIFLDAYPNGHNLTSGLQVDMANNIWNWKNEQPEYNPNPNPFLSLNGSEFIIGVRPMASCSAAVLQQVRDWLIAGLRNGAGSQINTGYGTLLTKEGSNSKGFLEVDFRVEGQLIHGQQRFTQWNFNDRRGEYQMRGQPVAESRPVAFKSMLRYWFRTLSLGVLPAEKVKVWESQIFGAINPQKRGWLRVEVLNGKVTQKEARDKRDPCGEQSGKLILEFSPEAPLTEQTVIEKLVKNLTWLMFHLGGIGQGARRPCYSRASRDYAPWWRGSDLIAASKDEFWQLPDSIDNLLKLFQDRIQSFYQALETLTKMKGQPRSPGTVSVDQWTEALDSKAVMLICAGAEKYDKPYALSVLHNDNLKVQIRGRLDYDPNLCGSTTSRPVKPSPVWIANFGDFQVVTIFGVTNKTDNPRYKFLEALQKDNNGSNYSQIYPII